MSSASNYFLAGKYFSRIFSLSDKSNIVKGSLQLFRLPESLHDWYFEKKLKNFPDEQITQISNAKDNLLTDNLKLFSDLFNRDVRYFDFDYHRIKKFSKEGLDTHKFNVEGSFQRRSFKNKITRYPVTQEMLLDSLSYYPVIDNDPKIIGLKSVMIESLFPKIKLDQEIVIISGEMIWSGWMTLNALLDLISAQKREQTLVIIDVWGVLQQFFYSESMFKELLASTNLQKFIEEVSLSILLLNKKHKSVKDVIQSSGKTAVNNLFVNKDIVKNYSQEISHKPDYVFISEKKVQIQKQIPLGIEINRVENLPLSILGKSQLILNLSPDVLLQKGEGSEVLWEEDIGQYPVYEEKYVKIKLPKQVELSVKSGQQVNKDELIGTRSVLKRLMREKLISTHKGRINTNYFELGLLKYDLKTGTEIFNAPFEGEITKMEKSKYLTKLFVNAHAYTIYPAYHTGPDISGKLVTLKELKVATGEKILLVKEKDFDQVNEELIIKNNIIGIIIVSVDYRKLRRFTQRLVNDKISLTIALLNPFSIRQFEEQNEILFLYTKNTVILSAGKISLLLAKNELKQVYLRLKSKKEKSYNSSLAKGEEVMIFNYSLQDRYARIEKLSNRNLSLATRGDLISTDLNNISKFTITELNAE